jgi:hypothetical protein
MKPKDDIDRLDELLTKRLRHEPAAFDFAEWARNHPDEIRLLRRGYGPPSRSVKTRTPAIWRFLMESKVTRYSAAAVILLALTLVLFGPFGAPGSGGVVLADVQQKVNGIETLIIRGTKTFTDPGEDGEVFEFDGIRGEFDLVKYFSAQHGLVEEGYAGGELIYRFTFNRPERQTLLLLPRYKKYGTFPSTDKQMRLLENLTPKGIIDLLREGNYKELGRDNIKGMETEVFEFQNPGTFKGLLPKTIADIQSMKGKVWIGIDQQLPVRVEGDLTVGKSFMTMFHELNLHEVNTLGDYNIALDDAIFDTTPPEGYTEITLTDILRIVPAEAKAGIAALGIIPVGLVFWKRRSKEKRTTAIPSCLPEVLRSRSRLRYY